ncbi:arf-GAP with coiled-coil, ANK repeat and PH domain-containing protein 1 [Thomomys bottae]
MDKTGSLGAAGGVKGEIPGRTTREGSGGGRATDADARLPPRAAAFQGSGPPLYSGGIVIPCPNSSRPSDGVLTLGSWPGEVVGHGLGPATTPGRASVPGITGASSCDPGGLSPGCSGHSGSTCCEERPRSILKNSSSTLVQKSPAVEKKSQRWDEMNILATYHPSDKDYGFMKVDEPSTPYHRMQDSDEDLSAGPSFKVTPETLSEKFATMDNFLPKVLQYGDNRNSRTTDDFSKTHSSDFDKHRKIHYNEGKFLKAQKNLPLDNDMDSSESSSGISSGIQGVMINPKPKPVERDWTGRLTREIKDKTGPGTSSRIGNANDSSAYGSHFPKASGPILIEQNVSQQRKEFYSKGRYLRSCSHPESKEDTEDEQDSESLSMSTEVHLLDHAGSTYREHKAAHESLDMAVTGLQPGTTMSYKNHRSQVSSNWCQWLRAKGLNCRSPGSSESKCESSQNPPSRNGRTRPSARSSQAKMTVKLDFEECLKDSPRFRASIELVEAEVSELETRLEKLLKLGTGLLESGRHYLAASRAFIVGICDLAHLGPPEPMMAECLEKFTVSLNHKLDSHSELLDATQHTLQQQIQSLVKEGLRDFREARRDFWRGAESLEAALAHNAEVPRRRAQEAEEAGAALKTARAGYRGRALDYALQINVIEDKRKFDIMEFVLRLVEAQATYFQQGHEELSQLAQYRKELGAQLHQLVLNSARETRDMEQRHVLLKQKELGGEEPEPSLKQGPNGLIVEGHLFKRASNAFKTWSRRWFTIQNNQLVYQKKYKDPVTVVVDDLRLCTVKHCPDSERRFCFEVVSTSKSCLLQADSERLLQLWISAVQSSIASAFSQARLDDSPRGPGQAPGHLALGYAATLGCGGTVRGREPGGAGHVAAQVQSVDGNAQCCDCREPAPEWASINLGVTLCIECSGIHRSLGVHFSKVRSLTLDSWEPELVKLMCELGNVVINQIYEARVESMAVKKPGPTCSRQEKEAWIHAKYVEKKFLTKLPEIRGRRGGRGPPRGHPPVPAKPCIRLRPGNISKPETPCEDLGSLHPGALLFRSAGQPPSLPTMADALAHGADVNWVNGGQENATPLIRATAANSLLACEFLLQNGANVNQADSAGRGPLHHATILGHTGLACLFLKRGADLGARDSEGRDPLTIAMETANADIVTLLRLAKMREAEAAQGQGGDETYLDIFRDFSLMASDDPEKLSRRSHDLHTL